MAFFSPFKSLFYQVYANPEISVACHKCVCPVVIFNLAQKISQLNNYLSCFLYYLKCKQLSPFIILVILRLVGLVLISIISQNIVIESTLFANLKFRKKLLKSLEKEYKKLK